MDSELQQIINDAPEWVCWVAQEENGTWLGFDNRPVVGLIPSGRTNDSKMYEDWVSDIEHGVTELTSIKLFEDKPNPDWQKTCKRARRKIKK